MAKIKEIRILEPTIKEIKKEKPKIPEEKIEGDSKKNKEEEKNLESEIENPKMISDAPKKTGLVGSIEANETEAKNLEDSLKNVTILGQEKDKVKKPKMYNETTDSYLSKKDVYSTEQKREEERKQEDKSDVLTQLGITDHKNKFEFDGRSMNSNAQYSSDYGDQEEDRKYS